MRVVKNLIIIPNQNHFQNTLSLAFADERQIEVAPNTQQFPRQKTQKPVVRLYLF